MFRCRRNAFHPKSSIPYFVGYLVHLMSELDGDSGCHFMLVCDANLSACPSRDCALFPTCHWGLCSWSASLTVTSWPCWLVIMRLPYFRPLYLVFLCSFWTMPLCSLSLSPFATLRSDFMSYGIYYPSFVVMCTLIFLAALSRKG